MYSPFLCFDTTTTSSGVAVFTRGRLIDRCKNNGGNGGEMFCLLSFDFSFSASSSGGCFLFSSRT